MGRAFSGRGPVWGRRFSLKMHRGNAFAANERGPVHTQAIRVAMHYCQPGTMGPLSAWKVNGTPTQIFLMEIGVYTPRSEVDFVICGNFSKWERWLTIASRRCGKYRGSFPGRGSVLTCSRWGRTLDVAGVALAKLKSNSCQKHAVSACEALTASHSTGCQSGAVNI